MPMKHEMWEPRLNAYLTGIQHEPFVMGKHDCCTFVAGAVNAMMADEATDWMSEFRGTYDSWESAADNLDNLENILTSKFGEPLNGCNGRKGDVCMAESALGLILGVYGIFLGANGLAYVKLSNLDHCWRVPE